MSLLFPSKPDIGRVSPLLLLTLSNDIQNNSPARSRDILERCGIADYRVGEDALYELVQSGKVEIKPDSVMSWVGKRKKRKNVRHSKETNRWGTDPDYVAMARQALGGTIELDPMSEEYFQQFVQADRYFTEKDDCFTRPWNCETMLLNPAGGLVVRAWRYLVQEYLAGMTKKCVWIGFSVEQLGLLADEPVHPDDFSKLTCRKRISFRRHDGFEGAPGHANYVVALGVTATDFELAFAGRGRFSHGRLSIGAAQTPLTSVNTVS